MNKSATQNADLPKRFIPCLTAGLSYQMSMKRPGVDGQRIQMLKQNYEELLSRALIEDSERASIFFKPKTVFPITVAVASMMHPLAILGK